MPGVPASPISLNEFFFPLVLHDSHGSSRSFTSVAPSGLAWRLTLGDLAECWLDSNRITCPFPGALTYIISLDGHRHPRKHRGSRHGTGRLVTRARRASLAQQGPLHEAEFASAGGSLQVEEVALDKEALQPAIRLANGRGPAVQDVLSGDPLNVQKDSADGVKHVWLLPSITGGRAESARRTVSCWPGGSLAGPGFAGSWPGAAGAAS